MGPTAPQHLERVAEVVRRVHAEVQARARGGVDEPEHRCVKREPPGGDGVAGGIAVDRVSKHGVTQVGEVHPHLVGAPGIRRLRAAALQDAGAQT